MSPLYLDWNLGLGDAIICNGLVRTLYARDADRKIILPCWGRNLPTVRHMFSDLFNVEVRRPANGDARPVDCREYEVLSIGVNNPRFGAIEPWDESFYVFAGVPFDAKWDMFHVPESGGERRRTGNGVFGVFHHDPSRGFSIDSTRLNWGCPLVGILPACLLTDWRYMISEAAEIHMIDSAPMHLAELLLTAGKLFYHKYARSLGNRNHRDATFRKPWVVLE